METLPPKVLRRLLRERTFSRPGPSGLLAILRDLKKERFTGRVEIHLSQGSSGEVKVLDSVPLPPPEEEEEGE